MTLSQRIREEAEPTYQAIRQHPFVEALAQGELPSAAALFYVQQDVQYLTTYARVFAMAIAQASTLDQMKTLAERMGMLFAGEIAPHVNLCRSAGASYDEVQASLPPLAPLAYQYAQHMIACGSRGDLAQSIAAVLPCHWVYADLGRDLQEDIQPDASHPFYDWITFYADNRLRDGVEQLCALLDQAAPTSRVDGARPAFHTSFQMEYRFFDMAWRQEGWPREVIDPEGGQ